MNYLYVGDMALNFQMRRHNAALDTKLATLTQEVTSGIKSDLGAALSGDFGALSAIDRSLRLFDAFDLATTEASQYADAMQRSLARIGNLDDGISTALMSAATTSSKIMIDATVASTAEKFDALIATLNTNSVGRYIFAGDQGDTTPLPDAETIITSLSAEISGATNATDVLATLDTWFADPSGFSATSYQGGEARGKFYIAEGETAAINVTANDPRVKDAIKGYAIGTLLDRGLFDGDLAQRSALAKEAGERIHSGSLATVELAAEVGSFEGKVASAATRNDTERASLEIARTKLIGADPYASATALEAVRSQIETLYLLTSRLSNLSMTDYM
ncbi:hypothetical protein BMI86_11200 [Thioclava sp. DLFJ5-1]|uniref:flagellin n=1 Tax=Thioclava sp. DLFJ5-1 TaxID=1915314 RepID=UPI0009981B85|nr:flagellin [Thioclava sp. DLFJ5-1]OOY20028.1 hypothetical protein BMI86_11200 [Thioclava sp. DLFJ5-1]